MVVFVLLIIASVIVAVLFAGAFLWSAMSGQYDDLHTPATRILLPERANRPASKDAEQAHLDGSSKDKISH